ncbi:ABC transporter permease [Nakamurella antarctica]|uniref:ABC transporter permease n=1 Tax=Nakamurella antarctica TaxID=1902245 RepID=A0A3G8ZLA6_9ACTN|nr:ABC transporter permease [Nakamurella antarctica]AZI58033.1 ABC transporter permease [Nakamurella antarctica]
MLWQLLRRCLIFLVSTVAASSIIFWIIDSGCGPAQTALGVGATPDSVAALCHQTGLDRPLLVQYWDWFSAAITGDFGTSYISQRPIGPQIFDQLSVTLWLVAGGIVVALLVAVPLGMASALRHGKVSGSLLSGISQVGIAVPAFVAALLLVLLFAVKLRWLPANGYVVPAQDPAQFFVHMLLPWLSLGLVQGAVLARYVRSAVLDELGQDYLRTARAKGLTPAAALRRHGLRNASIPVLTVIGVQLVTVLVGAVVIERIFTIPGIGKGLADAAQGQDLLTVQGMVLTLVVAALLISFVVDVLYTVIDPRLRQQAST